MGKKIKDYYDKKCAEIISTNFRMNYPKFNSKKFIADVSRKTNKLEFSGRIDVFANSLEEHLPSDWVKTCSIIEKSLGPELKESKGMFIHGWWLWPVGRLVERNCLKNPKRSISLIYELTKRFTGEFAIRPLLTNHPKLTLGAMLKWSKDKNVHVRRLASEGIRISLPWAKKSLVFVDHFEVCKRILTNLNEDTDMFVKKSVGNNLNDLYKFDSKLAKSIISEWQKSPANTHTEWIIRHGLRSLRK